MRTHEYTQKNNLSLAGFRKWREISKKCRSIISFNTLRIIQRRSIENSTLIYWEWVNQSVLCAALADNSFLHVRYVCVGVCICVCSPTDVCACVSLWPPTSFSGFQQARTSITQDGNSISNSIASWTRITCQRIVWSLPSCSSRWESTPRQEEPSSASTHRNHRWLSDLDFICIILFNTGWLGECSTCILFWSGCCHHMWSHVSFTVVAKNHPGCSVYSTVVNSTHGLILISRYSCSKFTGETTVVTSLFCLTLKIKAPTRTHRLMRWCH